jgi:AcrR family transcriptional regulator
MAARKVLTRAESQALTRQEVLESAERLFYSKGYYATSLAVIAAEAGRTIGAVYSNFASKEELCLEVLRTRYMSEVTKLLGMLVAAGDSMDARFEVLAGWWSRISSETSLTILTAEYATSTFYDEGQRTATQDVINRFRETARTLFEDTLPEGVDPDDPRMDDAIDAAVATGTGLAISQSIGVTSAEQSAALLVSTLRMWMQRLTEPAEDPKPARTRKKVKA